MYKGIFILSFKITYFRFTSEYHLQKYPHIKLMQSVFNLIFIYINIYTLQHSVCVSVSVSVCVCVCVFVCIQIGFILAFYLHQRGREAVLRSTHAYRKLLLSCKTHIVLWHTVATTRRKSCCCQLNLLRGARRNFFIKFLRSRIQLGVTKQHYYDRVSRLHRY